jgi:hypothetical protein
MVTMNKKSLIQQSLEFAAAKPEKLNYIEPQAISKQPKDDQISIKV